MERSDDPRENLGDSITSLGQSKTDLSSLDKRLPMREAVPTRCGTFYYLALRLIRRELETKGRSPLSNQPARTTIE